MTKNYLTVIEKIKIIGLDFEFRIFGDKDNPLFLATELARSIGTKNSSQMLEIVGGSAGICSAYIPTESGIQEMKLLTEKQVYRILMRSNQPVALAIQDGIFDFLISWRKKEVKVINNTPLDSYMISDPIERAKAWIKEQEAKELLILEKKELERTKAHINGKQLATAMGRASAAVRENTKIKLCINDLFVESEDKAECVKFKVKQIADMYIKNNNLYAKSKESIIQQVYQNMYKTFFAKKGISEDEILEKRKIFSANGELNKAKKSTILVVKEMGLEKELNLFLDKHIEIITKKIKK